MGQTPCSNQNGDPEIVTHSLSPQVNRMAIFEATPTSYHQVSEVLRPVGSRLSISGWFHGRLQSRLALRGFAKANQHFVLPTRLISADYKKYINPKYLAPQQKAAFKKKFEESSILTLNDFLNQATFAQLLQALPNSPPNTYVYGPASVRCFRQIQEQTNDEAFKLLHEISDSWRSTFIVWLEEITGLRISTHRVMGRMFKQGCYSLIHDHGSDFLGLDVILTLGNGTRDRWKPEYGGCLTYTAAPEELDDQEEQTLFTALPQPNVLTIVHRDEGVLKSIGWVKSGISGRKGRIDIEGVYRLKHDSNVEAVDAEDDKKIVNSSSQK